MTAVRAEISITPPEGSVFDGYAIYWRPAGSTGPWAPRGYSAVERITLDDLPTQGRFEIAVAPIVAGLEAPAERWTVLEWSPESTTDFTAPAVPGNFRAGQEGASVVLAWDQSTDPYVSHVEIRMGGAAWIDGIEVARVPYPGSSCRVGTWWTGSQTYRARTVSHQGLVSSDVSTMIDVEADSYAPVQATVDEDGGGFASTKTNTEVSSSKLRITKLPATANGWTAVANTYTHPAYLPHKGSGTYVTGWQDRGVVVRERVEVQCAFARESATFTADDWTLPLRGGVLDPGAPSIGDRLTPGGVPTGGSSIGVEIDTAQDGVPTSDGWRPWVPGTVYLFRQYRLRFTLSSIGFHSLEISTLKHRGRRLNRKDEVAVTVSGTGGTSVSFTTPFTAAPKVTATVIGSTSRLAVAYDVTASGCNVRIYDDTGAEQSSGTVHVHALGV